MPENHVQDLDWLANKALFSSQIKEHGERLKVVETRVTKFEVGFELLKQNMVTASTKSSAIWGSVTALVISVVSALIIHLITG